MTKQCANCLSEWGCDDKQYLVGINNKKWQVCPRCGAPVNWTGNVGTYQHIQVKVLPPAPVSEVKRLTYEQHEELMEARMKGEDVVLREYAKLHEAGKVDEAEECFHAGMARVAVDEKAMREKMLNN